MSGASYAGSGRSGEPLESASPGGSMAPASQPAPINLRSRARASMSGLGAARSEQLLQIMAAIADAVTEQELFEALVVEVGRAIGASSAGLWLVDESGTRAELVRGIGYAPEAERRLSSLPLRSDTRLPITDALQGTEPIWIPSQEELFERYPAARPYASPGRAYRVACLPLVVDRRTMGALGLTSDPTQQEEQPDEREFLLLLAHYATQSLLRLRLTHAERKSRALADAAARRLALLSRVSHTFASAELGFEERLRAVGEELARVLDGSVCIALRNTDDTLHLTGIYHPIPEAQAELLEMAKYLEVRLGEGVTGAMAAEGRSILVPRLDAAMLAARAVPAYREFLTRYPIYALIGACLKVAGRVIGTVTSTRIKEGETYTEDDLQLLEELAERAALAIDNSRLFQQALEARKRTEHLYRFASTVVAAERVEQVLEGALDAVEGGLEAERAAVLLFDDRGVMRFRRWRGLSDAYRAEVEGHSPWAPDAHQPRAILVEDASKDPTLAPFRALFEREGIGALAFVPLLSGGRLLGKFMVYYSRPRRFAPDYLETAHSIADHLAAAVSRYAALEKLRETIRNNERLSAVLAHDLRNPVAAIMMSAQRLLTRDESERLDRDAETRTLGKIARSGDRMKTMIEQLLDFARARSGGGIGVEPSHVDLADVCGQALDELEIAHPESRLERTLRGDTRGSWDADRLLQVCSNLLGNAVQHSPKGAVVKLCVDGSAPEQVTLEVHNAGTIPADALQRLFEPFHRGQHAQRTGGLGLGLFIVREIVRAHGGTVEVASSERAGTVFRVQLPRHCDRV